MERPAGNKGSEGVRLLHGLRLLGWPSLAFGEAVEVTWVAVGGAGTRLAWLLS